jgi:hypothetical protein
LDLLRGTCEVVESATEVDNKLVWGVTKTYERRMVRLPRFLCEQIGAYLVDRPHAPNDLVFTMLQGGPLREPKFAERYFSRPRVPLVCRPPCGCMIFAIPARAC